MRACVLRFLSRTLERQEREREVALAAFHKAIAARAHIAGEAAAAVNDMRAKREARLEHEGERRAAREAEDKARFGGGILALLKPVRSPMYL
jgi:hypothetical protein